jgi:hypothetical protein
LIREAKALANRLRGSIGEDRPYFGVPVDRSVQDGKAFGKEHFHLSRSTQAGEELSFFL